MLSDLEKEHRPEPQFELWSHPRNSFENGHRVLSYTPHALALVRGKYFDPDRGEERERTTPYVVMSNDAGKLFVSACRLTSADRDDSVYYMVPDGEPVVAAVGVGQHLVALTRGGVLVEMAAASQPATASAPATQATQPAATMQVVPDRVWNTWMFHSNDQKEKLAPLGDIGAKNGWAPSIGAEPVLMQVPGKLIVAWREPAVPDTLIYRTLSFDAAKPTTEPAQTAASAPAAQWSAPVLTKVSEPITRLMPLSLDAEAFVVWPVANPKTPAQLDLHGCALALNGHKAPHPLFPMDLGPMSENVDPKKDLAVAQCGTAVLVVTYGSDGKLRSRDFPASGKPAPPAQLFEAHDSGHAPSTVTQNIMIVIMVSLLAISLWQWRLRPIRLLLPKTFRVARLRERAMAAAIDLAIPTVLVLGVFHFYDLGDWADTFQKWDESLAFLFPFVLAANSIGWPQLCFVLALYLLHVTLGEIFTGRSIGKAIIKLRVVAMDGGRPLPLHVVVRNVVKLAEMGTGVLLIYIVISEHRQRLGDLLARTMVIDLGKRDGDDESAQKRDRENASADKR